MRIIDAADRDAVDAAGRRATRRDDPRSSGRPRRSSTDVRTRGDAAVSSGRAQARRTGTSARVAPLATSRPRQRLAARRRRRAPAHSKLAVRNLERVAAAAGAASGFRAQRGAGHRDRAARAAARPRRLLRARRPLSPAVDAPHDGGPGARGRRPRDRRRLPAAGAGRARGRARGRRVRASSPSAARRPLPRSRTARESIARVDKIVGPGNAWVAAAKALVSADCAIDLHAGPSEIVVASDAGNAPTGSRPT